MKKNPLSYYIVIAFILSSFLGYSQNIIKLSNEVDVEYEEVEMFERKYKTIFEEQALEYEYTEESKPKHYSQLHKTSKFHKISKGNKKRKHQRDELNIHEIDSVWKQELYSNDLYQELYTDVQNYDKENIDYNELSTETLIARLEALNEKTPFNIEYNPILENVIRKYLKTRKKSLERIIQKSHYYFPIFEEELDQFQIPMEIKYLAVVESALIPRIKSPVGATGLWQFMYETGKMHKLKVNSYVDERMDPLKSTTAACQYLTSLHKIFSDWDLALAAYNSGPGNVIKAIRRAKGQKNYWNIRHHLPRETAGYLPAFIATMYLFEYAEEHGLKRNPPKYTYFKTDTLKIKKKVTFKEISNAVNIDVKELQFLNPCYKLNIIPKSSTKPYSLRLPVNKISDFINYEDQLYGLADSREAKREKSMYHQYSKSKKFTYKVRSGDYLGKIASKFNTSISMIKSWNNLRSSTIKVGQTLTIYNKKAKPSQASL